MLDKSEIGVFYLADGMVWVKTVYGETFHINNSWTKLKDELSSADFFRINRQTIVSRKAVKGFEKLSYQKLQIILIDPIGYDSNLVVSKYNAPVFKKWLTNSA